MHGAGGRRVPYDKNVSPPVSHRFSGVRPPLSSGRVFLERKSTSIADKIAGAKATAFIAKAINRHCKSLALFRLPAVWPQRIPSPLRKGLSFSGQLSHLYTIPEMEFAPSSNNITTFAAKAIRHDIQQFAFSGGLPFIHSSPLPPLPGESFLFVDNSPIYALYWG